jgi:hypothetical protein
MNEAFFELIGEAAEIKTLVPLENHKENIY